MLSKKSEIRQAAKPIIR